MTIIAAAVSIWLSFYPLAVLRESGDIVATDDDKLIRLHSKLVEVLGEGEADTLMSLLLPARWDLIALRNSIPRPTSV